MEIGFSAPLEVGASLLPGAVGKTTRFNLDGREFIRRDLDKVTTSKMVWGTWPDWHGNRHSGLQFRNYYSYPREHIPGPEEELSIAQNPAGTYVVSRALMIPPDDEDTVIHIINMFLEIFGECDLLDESSIPLVKVRRVNWKILPPGEYPWEKAKGAIQKITERLPRPTRAVVDHRIDAIAYYKPDVIAVGQGGFEGYFVFGFSNKGLFVLESSSLDNATYVLSSNWQELSSLTKREILRGNLHHSRLVHNESWSYKLRDLLK